jgi:glycosyltransferase involved in cell wall biosynthesis
VKIFLAATSLLPDYGGPAFSVSRLAAALADAGAEVALWASDQSVAQSSLLPSISCLQRFTGPVSEALDRFGDIEVLHDNGIWLLHNHLLATLAEKRGILRVVSTRGMLEPWALSHKPFKKRLAWRLYQERDLKRARCHITSGELEARNLQRLDLGVPIITIPNGVDTPEETTRKVTEERTRGEDGRQRTALFLGRIYPIKGLPMLIEAWARVRPEGWLLRIAGPDEAGHMRQVERAISAAGLGRVVSFAGPLEAERKRAAFLDADLFVLPSHSESFGMAVAEAMAHGLPVLTTTAAPWSILREKSCGWWVDATVDGLAEALYRATRLNSAELQAIGAKGRALIRAEFSWARIADRMLSTYEDLARHAA